MKKVLPILILLTFIVAVFYFYKKGTILPKSIGDLHLHTTCSDGNNTYDEIINATLKKQLSFIAITDHEVCPDILAKCKAENRILCFPGQEITTKRIHIVAVNINKYINPNLELGEKVKQIHIEGGLAIAAHPNIKSTYYTDGELKNFGIDFQECTSNINERRILPCVFNSDAHEVESVGWQYNSCSVPIKNITDLKDAILEGKCGRGVN